MSGWSDIRIEKGRRSLFCRSHIASESALNVIVTHTPVVSTADIQQVYEPLAVLGANVFAFDFSCSGRSKGISGGFSRDSIVSDVDTAADYIRSRFGGGVHLYGSTGIGGMLAQYCACACDSVQSLALFACVDYKNTAALGVPQSCARALSFALKRLPEFRITLKPPKYTGFNAEIDNSFYDMLLELEPNAFKSSTKVLNTVLECFTAPDSAVKNGPRVPTLIFKTLHDRYFPPEYFDACYAELRCKKRLVVIDDVHNSYYFRSGEFCRAAYEWFAENPRGAD